MSVSVDQARELAKNWRARHCETVAAALESLADQLDDIRSIGGGLTIEGMQESVDRAEAVQNQDEIIAALRAQLEERERALVDAERCWSFDQGQLHTHSWHDREDWCERHGIYDIVKRLRAPMERP